MRSRFRLRLLQTLMAALGLLAIVSSDRAVRAESQRIDVAKAPRAAFDTAISAYRQGDYPNALELFLRLARTGHPDARYYLGIMYALGQGTAPDNVRGYVWLSCVAVKADDAALKLKAEQQRIELRKRLSYEQVYRAHESLEHECGVQVAANPDVQEDDQLFNPFRGKLFERLVFFAGDVIVIGLIGVARLVGAAWMQDFALSLYKYYGDWFVGLVSLVWWALFARVVYLVWEVIAGLRSPTEFGRWNNELPSDRRREDRSGQ